MRALRATNLVLRFFLELAALAAFGYWGATVHGASVMRVALAIALPVFVAIIWGIFISPKATIPTGIYGRAGLGLIVFAVAALALMSREQSALATALAVLAITNAVLMLA